MNINYYRNFLTVVEMGSLTKAAKKLYIAQSALSSQIKAMETEFGVELINRGPRLFELTEAGRIVYEKAKAICFQEDSIHKKLSELQCGKRGTLRFGCTACNPDNVVEPLLCDFAKLNPGVEFEIYERKGIELYKPLQDGDLDVALLRTNSRLVVPASIKKHFSYKENLVAVFPAENPWWDSIPDKITMDMLLQVPLSCTFGIFNLLSEISSGVGQNALIYSRSSSRNMVLIWPERGEAVGLLPCDRTFRLNNQGLVVRPVDLPEVYFERFLASEQGVPLSPVAQSFIEFSYDWMWRKGLIE